MGMSFPKLTRLSKPASPDCLGIGDSPLGFILVAWQGQMVVRLHVLAAHAEKHLNPLLQDWGWPADITRDDKRASAFVNAALFPKGKWTGVFPAGMEIGFNGTDFQWQVMRKMLRIPSGKTLSYAGLADAAAIPRAARAAGSVCARNPLPLIVPCHRVLTAAGQIGNYGYGPAMKRQFLEWEKRRSAA